MTDIEPIITAWLLSPIGLVVTAVVAIVVIAITLSKIITSYPSKE